MVGSSTGTWVAWMWVLLKLPQPGGDPIMQAVTTIGLGIGLGHDGWGERYEEPVALTTVTDRGITPVIRRDVKVGRANST